jgi:hypothetical protein
MTSPPYRSVFRLRPVIFLPALLDYLQDLFLSLIAGRPLTLRLRMKVTPDRTVGMRLRPLVPHRREIGPPTLRPSKKAAPGRTVNMRLRPLVPRDSVAPRHQRYEYFRLQY